MPDVLGNICSHATPSASRFHLATTFIAAGFGDSEIARLTGIPRTTISGWRHNRGHRYHERLATATPLWRPVQPGAYCRTINRFRTKLPSGRIADYEYPRYFFSNLSADIRAIFCEHCELLGIRWTQSNARNLSVAHRKSVALLDEFIGPKA